MSNNQISQLTGLSESTVKMYLSETKKVVEDLYHLPLRRTQEVLGILHEHGDLNISMASDEIRYPNLLTKSEKKTISIYAETHSSMATAIQLKRSEIGIKSQINDIQRKLTFLGYPSDNNWGLLVNLEALGSIRTPLISKVTFTNPWINLCKIFITNDHTIEKTNPQIVIDRDLIDQIYIASK